MKRIIALWLAVLMLAVQPIQAAVCVGFGQSTGGGETFVPDVIYDFEDNDLSGFTVTDTANNDISITSTDPLTGTYSLLSSVVNETKDDARITKTLPVARGEIYAKIKFKLDPNYAFTFSGSTITILNLKYSGITTKAINLYYLDGSVYLADNNKYLITKNVTHEITIRLVADSVANDGWTIWVDGELGADSGYTSAYTYSLITAVDIGHYIGGAAIAGSWIRIDDVQIGVMQ